MPLYEYECSQCHRRTEKIQKFSDAELTVCPHCGGPLARTITAPSFQFAGGGWYKDGYGNAKPAAGAGGETAGKPAGDSAAASAEKPAAAAGSTSGEKPAAAAKPAAAPATKPGASGS
jgi:putative FmdB family regulatory protein